MLRFVSVFLLLLLSSTGPTTYNGRVTYLAWGKRQKKIRGGVHYGVGDIVRVTADGY